jgi:predicted lipoprotein with Yx(FWY)xxD motif
MTTVRGTTTARDMKSGLRRAAGVRLLLRVLGAGLLIASAAVHLDLYLTGYRTIPTIGWLFLLQLIVGFILGLAVLVTGSRLVAAAGALFALSTLGGYLLTVQFGLFGFQEVRTTAGIVAGLLEVLAFAALGVVAAMPGAASGRHTSSREAKTPLVGRAVSGVNGGQAGLGAAVISVVALGLLAGALVGAGGGSSGAGSGSGSASQAASGGLRTTVIGGKTVLTNAAGKTLYWFAPDTASKSACYGSCAAYWPPVVGPLKAGSGVTGHLGTIRRTDGSLQETYNGHPLYTYVGDSGPGQAHGNKLNLNGGLWYEMLATG